MALCRILTHLCLLYCASLRTVNRYKIPDVDSCDGKWELIVDTQFGRSLDWGDIPDTIRKLQVILIRNIFAEVYDVMNYVIFKKCCKIYIDFFNF